MYKKRRLGGQPSTKKLERRLGTTTRENNRWGWVSLASNVSNKVWGEKARNKKLTCCDTKYGYT